MPRVSRAAVYASITLSEGHCKNPGLQYTRYHALSVKDGEESILEMSTI